MCGGIVEQRILQDRGDQRDAGGRGDRRGAIAAKRGAGGDLAANGDDVGQRLVEIAHLFGLHADGFPNFAMQSISDAAAMARGRARRAGRGVNHPRLLLCIPHRPGMTVGYVTRGSTPPWSPLADTGRAGDPVHR